MKAFEKRPMLYDGDRAFFKSLHIFYCHQWWRSHWNIYQTLLWPFIDFTKNNGLDRSKLKIIKHRAFFKSLHIFYCHQWFVAMETCVMLLRYMKYFAMYMLLIHSTCVPSLKSIGAKLTILKKHAKINQRFLRHPVQKSWLKQWFHVLVTLTLDLYCICCHTKEALSSGGSMRNCIYMRRVLMGDMAADTHTHARAHTHIHTLNLTSEWEWNPRPKEY